MLPITLAYYTTENIQTEYSSTLKMDPVSLQNTENSTSSPFLENLGNASTFLEINTFQNNTLSIEKEPPMDMFNLYVGAIILATIFVIIRCFVTYHYTIKVSKNMHKAMTTNILQGYMSFFDTNLIGNVLTRFSRDLYMMDELIPFIWLEGFRVSG